MTYNALKYCVRQVCGSSIVGLIPAIFIGALKFGTELAYGHSAKIALGPAAAFFVFVYVLFVVGTSVVSLFMIKKKAHQAGVSLDYLGGLSKDERAAFEKQHGI